MWTLNCFPAWKRVLHCYLRLNKPANLEDFGSQKKLVIMVAYTSKLNKNWSNVPFGGITEDLIFHTERLP